MTVPSRFAISKTEPGDPIIHTLKVNEIKKVEKNKIRKVAIHSDGCMSITEFESKVILLVGETGSGKTLMMNALLNYVLGVKWEDSYRYKLEPDELESKKPSQTQSQTEWISIYTLQFNKSYRIPYSITIIDTPGFGDTAGTSKDKKTTEQMKSLFNGENDEGIDRVNAVIFVAQSGKVRLTNSQRYVFDSILLLFGKNVKDNIFLFTTFADQNVPLVLEGMEQASIPYKAYYRFNNSPLYAQKESASAREEGSSDDDDDGERETFNKLFWESGAKQLNKFFIKLGKTSSKSTRLSFEVLREREALNARMKAIPQLIQSNLVTLERLNRWQKMLKASQEEVNKHRNYTYTVTKENTTKEILSKGEYAMTCRNCKINCHYPCGTYIKFLCPAFYWFNGCSVCPQNCSISDHDCENFIYVKQVVSEKLTYADVKVRYDKAYNKVLSHNDFVTQVSQEEANIREDLTKHISEICQIFKRLDEIALKKNPTSVTDYLQSLIETEKTNMVLGWEDRVDQLGEVLGKLNVEGDLAEEDEDLLD